MKVSTKLNKFKTFFRMKVASHFSKSSIAEIVKNIHTTYLSLNINQRLYINALVTFLFFLLSLGVLDKNNAKGFFYLFCIFWFFAIVNDFLAAYKRIYETVIGKGFLILSLAICTNLSIALSSQLINDIVGIDPSKLPHTIAFLSILLIPIFITLAIGVLYFMLIVISPLLFMFQFSLDDKAKEVLVPGYSATPKIAYQKQTRVVQVISFIVFCGFIFSASQKALPTYEKFLTKTASSFIFNMEMYSKAPCVIEKETKVAFIADGIVLIGSKTPAGFLFKTQECKALTGA